MSEPLPCPFCAAAGMFLIKGSRWAEGSTVKEDAIRCRTCDAQAPLKSWNTRVPAPSAREQIAERLALFDGNRMWEITEHDQKIYLKRADTILALPAPPSRVQAVGE